VSDAVRSGWGAVDDGVARALARPGVRLVAGNLLVGVGYWALAMLGSLAQYTGNIQVAWLPVGWAAAMLYLGDMRWWAGGLLGELAIGENFVPFHGVVLNGQSWLTTGGNMAEFVVAALLMRRWLGRGNRLERPADVMLLIVALGIGTAISALVGNLAAVWLGGMPWSDFASSFRTWWLGDTSGGLLIAPLLLAWWGTSWPPSWRPREAVQALVILGAVAGLSVAVFSSHHPLTYVVFPALVVAAVYLGQRGATLALVLTYAVAVAMTAASVGPFVSRSIDDQTLSSQLYILIATVTTLTLGAAVSARQRTAMDLAESRRRETERAAEERQRIARELHDSVSQTLFSLGLHAGIAKHAVAQAQLAEDSPLPGAIDEVADLAQGALLEMRASIFDLRGGAVAEQGLVAALGAHGAALAVRHDVRVSVEGPEERLPLEPAVEELLFRIGQESITNAVKHSGSPAVSVEVSIEDGNVALTVRDSGVGFDPARSYGGHLGLELLRSRAADAGGSVTIDSQPDEGTTVRAVVPAIPTAAAPRDLPAPRAARPASVS
jgi:signal transduction histidine kinase